MPLLQRGLFSITGSFLRSGLNADLDLFFYAFFSQMLSPHPAFPVD